MAYSNNDFIWTPDESTPYDYTANLANMGSSIENVVGPYVYSATGIATPKNTTNFGPYTAGNVIRAVRNGKYVTLAGTWACKTANYLRTGTDRPFAGLPVGFRPKYHFYQIMQGSGYTSWLFSITPGGELRASRQSADSAPSAGYWMPFNITYLAED
jgi:hypothetical protein